jgi:adenylate cyclase class 2
VSYEVEQKFPVAELAAVQERLVALGAQLQAEREDRDLYFAHPARDFARTDEALRIRRVGTSNFITYKGPKIDPATKTRREIELDLPPGETAAAQWTELLEYLGFGPWPRSASADARRPSPGRVGKSPLPWTTWTS